MKLFKLFITSVGILVFALLIIYHFSRSNSSVSQKGSVFNSEASEGTKENPLARLEYEWLRLHNPATKRIPKGVAQKELEFVHQLARQTDLQPVSAADSWITRGPYNIGGRTKALALDILNENVILAGSVSSGMYKSTDGGNSWAKTTAANQLHSLTSIAQNMAPGREHIWYYGTGDRTPTGITNSAMGLFGTNAFYRGDGIFKSVDGGDTWAQLASTISGTADQTDAFDFVWQIVTFGEDGVMAATSSGLFRSTDGGASWTQHLNFGEETPIDTSPSREIAITGDGTFYATIGGNGPNNGIYRSADGESWENISPAGWPEATVRTVMSVAPSNENMIYFFTEVASLEQQLKKYEAGVGWTDLTSSLPFNAQLTTFGGYMLMIYVKPDDEDTIFLGAVDLFRSTDGGETFELISGTGGSFHQDQTAIVFYPSNPKRMIVGNDGGLFTTDDNIAETNNQSLEWESLNNGYLTTQFYTVAIDHGTPGSEAVIGGTQDNGVVYTSSPDPEAPWRGLAGGDGGYTAMSDGGGYFYYALAATYRVFRHSFPDGGEQRTEITPASGRLGLWLTIFQLDPHDQKMMYLPSRTTLWRNSDMTAIPHQLPPVPTEVNWETLDNVKDHYITALGMSEAEPRRLYYAGAFVGAEAAERVFYLDDPQEGQPVPVDITGENFPFYPFSPFISCIAVDPRDADKVMVIFPSYGVLSIYASENGGESWTPVSGNLEENPDGTGSGPSVRWVSILYVQEQPVYFAGTSVGLFSTTKLDGMNTTWVPEAATTIGNVVVDMIDVRQSDGFVAVATHGNGIYSTYTTEVPTSISESVLKPETFELFSAYPNPFNASTTIRYQLPGAGFVTANVYNIRGQKIETLFKGRQQAGKQELLWNAGNVASGAYFIQVSFENTTKVKKVVLQK